MDPVKRLVHKAGTAVHLSPKEFDLLHYLMSHAGLPLMHPRLLRAVWGPNTAANWNIFAPTSDSSKEVGLDQ